jgi:Zn finger protein HypA/HybF involved in hydrogenase expression
MKRLNNNEFIKRSNLSHENKYDYSLVEYKNNRTKVEIICPEHGVFKQIPDSHMKGFGCSKCSGNYNYSNNEFIEILKSKFGEKYKYDKVKYSSQNKKVIIVCEKHGNIEKYPQSLMNGSGCSKCESKNYKINTSEFIKRAIRVHGETYRYEKVKYINDSTPVKIICDKHGEFIQTPNIHLSGSGCIICSGRYKYNNDEFINKSIAIHGNKYDYSLVEYENAHKKVKIICKKHGIFNQKPNSHLSKKGCPSCNESKGEIKIYKFLDKLNIKYIRQKKFTGCEDKSLLPFDFYLPNHNICIEYDGEQHFTPVKNWGGEKSLQKIIKRDQLKNKFCEENNINLLRIKYVYYDQIEEILKSYLKVTIKII